jgi:chromosome segregation protein
VYETVFEPVTLQFALAAISTLGLAAGHSVLDVGAGSGGAALAMAAQGLRVTAIDASARMVDRILARAGARGLSIDAQAMDGQALQFEDATFDAALSVLGIILFPDAARGLAEMRRVVRPGGRVSVVTWTRPQNYELAAELRRLGGEEAEVRRVAAEAGERAGGIDVERARLEAEADEARRRLEEAGADPAEGDDREELAARIERLERRRETLGQVNPLAKEEYDREKERLTELAEQRADLEASLKELEQLRAELAETVERRFDETFTAVTEHFGEVAATLFPGGEGRLRLTEPAEDGEEPGVEVELRPHGKRVTRLTLLSGGEKALGAISFLFALFLARPCPFYLLDEVEAALDDANIVRFVELLRRYADRAQFIVITHQKRTMEAADVLYGVTMGGDGVSQIVSRRLPREEAVAAAS